MYLLKLFHSSEPTRMIASRVLAAGDLTIGRDSAASWRIEDPNRELSRIHCAFSASPGGLTVSDMSTNGVVMGSTRTRLPARAPIPLSFGDSLIFAGFTLTIEQARGATAGPQDAFAPDRSVAKAQSPFAPPEGLSAPSSLSSPRSPDPYASALPPDPLGGRGRDPGARPEASLLSGDVWERRPTPRAGDWNAISADLGRDHARLIGSDRPWSEPVSQGPGEAGFGFDAPFNRPMLKEVPVSAQALLIPSDWDSAPLGGAPASSGGQGGDAFGQSPGPPPDQRMEARRTPPPSAPPPAPVPPQGFGAPAYPPAAPPADTSWPSLHRSEPAPVPPPPPAAPAPLLQRPGPQGAFSARYEPGPVMQPPQERAPSQEAGAYPYMDPRPSMDPQAAQTPRYGSAPQAPFPPQPFPPQPLTSAPAQALAPPPLQPDPGQEAARLLLAFCEGAKLSPQDLAGQDPAEVLRRAGVLYQQMVLGLSDLLSERTSVKNEFRMARTTVRPEGNNPFKWAPPRRVAVDLLCGRDDGFLSGPAAVRESFEDLKKHLLCLLSAMRASLAATLTALSPSVVEGRLKTQGFGIRGGRAAAAWAEYERLHADFQHQADDNADSQINREFRAAYERQLRDLDDLSQRK